MLFDFSTSLIALGIFQELNVYYFIGIIFIIMHLLILQIYKFDKSNKERCLIIFKSNNLLGLIIFSTILIGKF